MTNRRNDVNVLDTITTGTTLRSEANSMKGNVSNINPLTAIGARSEQGFGMYIDGRMTLHRIIISYVRGV